MLSDLFGDRGNDGGVGVEEVVARHAGLARNSGRADDHIAALEGIGKLRITGVTRDSANSTHVAEICSNSGCVDYVVETQVTDVGRVFKEKRHGLADATRSANDTNLGKVTSRRKVAHGITTEACEELRSGEHFV